MRAEDYSHEVLMITKCVNTDGKFPTYGPYFMYPPNETAFDHHAQAVDTVHMNINYWVENGHFIGSIIIFSI